MVKERGRGVFESPVDSGKGRASPAPVPSKEHIPQVARLELRSLK